MTGNQTIGDRIRAAREARGWSVEELAKACGLPPWWTQSVESGGIPTIREILAYARALGLSLDYVLTGEDEHQLRGELQRLMLENETLKAELKELREPGARLLTAQ